MAKRSIRKIIAGARRESFRGLKHQIRGRMCVDDITVDTHLAVFSEEYMRLFWSHLITGCNFLRRLSKDETCARPKDIIRKVSRQYTIGVYNGATKIHLKDSTFYIKEYGELLSCGPYSFGNAVLNIRADDAVGLMTAYDQEIRRCNEVVSKAIKEALTEAAALEIALTTAKTVADDIITRYGLDIEATDAGRQRVKFLVTFSKNPIFEKEFWASLDEFRPRLMGAVRSLQHQELISFR